jgi:hypothetical protein
MKGKYSKRRAELEDPSYEKNVKKKALGRNYQRIKWQDSPDSSDNEEKFRQYAASSCESDNSDELERTRKKHYKARALARKAGGVLDKNALRFNFDKDLHF